MTLTISEILKFPKLYDNIKNLNLPIRTIYKLAQLKKEFDFHINFYQDNLQQIILNYSENDENGNPLPTEDGKGIKIKTEKIEECEQKISELLGLLVNIPEIEFNLSEFEKVELTYNLLEPLLPFIKD